jgi:hypothetical protein
MKMKKKIEWSMLQDSYGPADESGQLIERYLDHPNESLGLQISNLLVHQGWRCSATPVAIEILGERAMNNLDFLEQSIDLISDLCIGQASEYYPDFNLYDKTSKSARQLDEHCEPSSMGSFIRSLAENLAANILEKITNFRKQEARMCGLNFLLYFLSDRLAFHEINKYFLNSLDDLDRFGAICINSMLGVAVHVNQLREIYELNSESSSTLVSAHELPKLVLPVYDGTFEVALIKGCQITESLPMLTKLAVAVKNPRRFTSFLRKRDNIDLSRFDTLMREQLFRKNGWENYQDSIFWPN